MSSPMKKEELDLGLHLSCGEIHAKEAFVRGMEQNKASHQASPWLAPSSTMIGSSKAGSMMNSSAAQQQVGMASESMTTGGGGYYSVAPAVVANNKVERPLQLTIAPAAHVPAGGINLNLPPPPEQAPPIVPGKTWSGKETANPFERPLLGRVGRNKEAQQFYILESSEVGREYAERQQQQQMEEEAALAADNKRRVAAGQAAEPDAGPAAKRERRYRWPAKTVANINTKIEQLRKEASCSQEHRRSLAVIEAEIGKLQAKKDEIHARVTGQQKQQQQGEGSSSAPRPPRPPSASGN